MPKYIVKDNNDRNLIIEADELRSDTQEYRFLKKTEENGNVVVAYVPRVAVFAIVEEESEGADYYFSDRDYDDRFNGAAGHSNPSLARSTAGEPELDDVCTDCRNQELFDSEGFFSAVFDIVEAYHEPDVPEVHARKVNGEVWWGFINEDGNFINFSEKENAEEGLKMYLKGDKNWESVPLSKTELIPEVVQ